MRSNCKEWAGSALAKIVLSFLFFCLISFSLILCIFTLLRLAISLAARFLLLLRLVFFAAAAGAAGGFRGCAVSIISTGLFGRSIGRSFSWLAVNADHVVQIAFPFSFAFSLLFPFFPFPSFHIVCFPPFFCLSFFLFLLLL